MSSIKQHLLTPCRTPDQLHAWVRLFTGLNLARTPVIEGHTAPFDYICRAYFEPACDQLVWAPRGGGKTRLAALATLLDLLHKPGVGVRILGGSLEQSLKTWEYLLPDTHRLARDLIAREGTRRLTFTTGSDAAVLTQSQRAVRGLRVAKLRCDEVELFDRDVWEAVQLSTRSSPNASASLDALSTLHVPFGLMSDLVEQHPQRLVKWSLLDVLEHCPPERECTACPLWHDCRGRAKTLADGHLLIDDAITMKRRVSRETWETEMLCLKPSVRGRVFPTFDQATHVAESVVRRPSSVAAESTDHGRRTTDFALAIDFGFAAPFVCLFIAMLSDGTKHVLDEYVQPGRTMAQHLAEIAGRPWPAASLVACDPAGGHRNEQTATSNVQLLRDAGYRVRTRASRIVDGIELIRHSLSPASGRATLYIHPRCTHLIRAMQSYRYASDRDELPLKDGTHDHLIDALRYFHINTQTHKAGWRRY